VEVNPARADVWLYHLGNNQLHRAIYRRALAKPGWFCDAVLQHFSQLAHEQEYLDTFVYNYGEWHRGTAQGFGAAAAARPRKALLCTERD
jgi:hypothetical protein